MAESFVNVDLEEEMEGRINRIYTSTPIKERDSPIDNCDMNSTYSTISINMSVSKTTSVAPSINMSVSRTPSVPPSVDMINSRTTSVVSSVDMIDSRTTSVVSSVDMSNSRTSSDTFSVDSRTSLFTSSVDMSVSRTSSVTPYPNSTIYSNSEHAQHPLTPDLQSSVSTQSGYCLSENFSINPTGGPCIEQGMLDCIRSVSRLTHDHNKIIKRLDNIEHQKAEFSKKMSELDDEINKFRDTLIDIYERDEQKKAESK